MANERTFLAWVRTSLAMVAGAVVIHTPAVDFDLWIKTTGSLSLLAVAGLAMALAWMRWQATESAIRTGEPLPGFGGPALLAAVICVLILAVAVGVIVVAVR